MTSTGVFNVWLTIILYLISSCTPVTKMVLIIGDEELKSVACLCYISCCNHSKYICVT